MIDAMLPSLVAAGVTGIVSAGVSTYATVKVLSVRIQWAHTAANSAMEKANKAHSRVDRLIDKLLPSGIYKKP